MRPHLSIITLGVNDVEKSSNFYQSLGFPIETSDITFIKLPNIWLALYSLDELAKDAGVRNDKNGFSGITLAHNVISKEQVDVIFEELKNAQVTVTDQPHTRDWGGYSGYFQDPDGYLWEVAYNPYSPEIAVDEAKKD